MHIEASPTGAGISTPCFSARDKPRISLQVAMGDIHVLQRMDSQSRNPNAADVSDSQCKFGHPNLSKELEELDELMGVRLIHYGCNG